jgi:hypothetical protein
VLRPTELIIYRAIVVLFVLGGHFRSPQGQDMETDSRDFLAQW